MKKKIESIILDEDFKHIELKLSELNIFKCLSIERAEIRHSNFIAFILDPKKPHGLGDVAVRKLLKDIFSDSKASARNTLDADKLNLQNIEVRREWKNIDILIILERDIVVIENKVDAVDHLHQLETYKEIAKNTFPNKNIHHVYLTPFGDDPQDIKHRNIYINYSYKQLAEIIESILKNYKNSDNQKMYFYLSDYLVTIKRELLMNDELNKLAVKLYNAHKEAFDFIDKYKPEPAIILEPFFSTAVKNNGFIEGSQRNGFARFTTDKLRSKFREIGMDCPDIEIFSFKLINEQEIRFQACIHPSKDTNKRDALHKAVELSGYKKCSKKAERWIVFYKKDFTFSASEIMNKGDDEIRTIVEEIVENIIKDADAISERIVNNLPASLQSNSKP